VWPEIRRSFDFGRGQKKGGNAQGSYTRTREVMGLAVGGG
jgi:hypothetical protein